MIYPANKLKSHSL